MLTIYALFSVENLHDQPEHNLVAWWPEHPTLEQLGEVLSTGWPGKTDNITLALVNIWQGRDQTLGEPHDNTAYRVRALSSGGVTEMRK